MNLCKHNLPALLLLAGMGFASTASASLEVRPGGMVYDTDRNITWLADANYAKTSGYDIDGVMDWPAAMAWAENLVYGGYDDWRLPTALNADGSGPCASHGCTGSEIGHLYHQEFGVPASSSIYSGKDSELAKFSNIAGFSYWTATEYAPFPADYVWYFHFGSGLQVTDIKPRALSVWAVRSGDVAAVPLPAAVWLFGSALSGVGMLAARRRRG